MKQLRVLALAPSLLLTAFAIVGCASAPSGPPAPIATGDPRVEPQPTLEDPKEVDPELALKKPPTEEEVQALLDGVTPPHMTGRDIVRAAVLLPFSHPNRQVRDEAQSMLAAIELALFEGADDTFLIMPKDTAGTISGTQDSFTAALEDDADIILGPLFAQNVREVRPQARAARLPVIAFSNDPTAGGGGTFLAAFTVEQEVDRVVSYALDRGIDTFVFLGPRNSYGQRVEAAMRRQVMGAGAFFAASRFYDPANDAPVDEARELADVLIPLTETAIERVGVMIPESGVKLRGVAPLLPYYGVDFRKLRMLGTSQWNDPSLWREPTLTGGWFALAPRDETGSFDTSYERVYGRSPSRLAGLGYDAAGVAIGLSRAERLNYGGLLDENGFLGVNGLFRFGRDGQPERALSVMEISPSDGAVEVLPAATSFPPSVGES